MLMFVEIWIKEQKLITKQLATCKNENSFKKLS